MMAWHRRILWTAIIAASCFAVSAHADFCTDFENYQGLPEGFPVTGQFGWYIPAGTSSVDFNVYTYFTGNPLGIPDNPTGGLFFIAGRGPGGTTFARAQRDIVLSNATWEMAFDLCANFVGAAATNNVGSFSAQPAPNDFIHLYSWFPGFEGTRYQIGYMVYDAGGTQAPQPGIIPGPAWENLPLNTWFRLSMMVDFATNRMTQASITNIMTGASTTVNPADWYLEGGAAGSTAPMTAFRFFAGGSNDGNVVAADNVCLRDRGATAVEPSTWGSIKAQFTPPVNPGGKAAPLPSVPEVQ